jgi:hypothetical protein
VDHASEIIWRRPIWQTVVAEKAPQVAVKHSDGKDAIYFIYGKSMHGYETEMLFTQDKGDKIEILPHPAEN